ncbi:MAG TPA: CPBP family glutamic-type intramembrane protease [Anaerolineaceae bacterium]|nr:CPBP family glutamic-type intramembrane protease [Anaerolineaceae bacterium]
MEQSKSNEIKLLLIYSGFFLLWLIIEFFFGHAILARIVFSVTFVLILLAEKQWHILKKFLSVKASYHIYLIPVGLEYAITLIYRAFLNPANLLTFQTTTEPANQLKNMLRHAIKTFFSVLNEEIIFRFVLLILFLIILRMLKVQDIKLKHLISFLFISALIFSLGHTTTYIGQATLFTTNKPEFIFFLISALVSAVAFGLYFNAVFLKTHSLAIVTTIHFLVNVCRWLFSILPLGNMNAFLISLNIFSLIYFFSALIIMRKGFDLEKLGKIFTSI